jgi:large subunit ribosomal protein L21
MLGEGPRCVFDRNGSSLYNSSSEASVYAIIEAGGKQYRVAPGESIEVESVGAEVGESLEINRVLLVVDGGEVAVGNPLVSGARVLATVTERGKGRKATVFKFAGGNRYQRKRGHRQGYARLLIEKVVHGEVEEERAVPAEEPEKPQEPEKPGAKEKKRKAAPPRVTLEELELPSRVMTALQAAGLKTALDVAKLSDEELLAVRGFGAKSLEQVRSALKEKGLGQD